MMSRKLGGFHLWKLPFMEAPGDIIMPPVAVLLAVALLGCPSLGHGAGSASAAGVAGAGSEPPWEKKLETVFLGLKASVTKISEEQNHLAHEWKRLSKAETTQVASPVSDACRRATAQRAAG